MFDTVSGVSLELRDNATIPELFNLNDGEHILALDLSTSTGWCAISNVGIRAGRIKSPDLPGMLYPYSYIRRAEGISSSISRILLDNPPFTVILIEETNSSRSRYTQKMLEFIHMSVLLTIEDLYESTNVLYVNTSDWRKIIGLQLTKEQKKMNAKLARAKRLGKSKVSIGIRGRITKKHLAVNYVNSLFKNKLKVKDNDVAEAICIGLAYLRGFHKNGFKYCNGK